MTTATLTPRTNPKLVATMAPSDRPAPPTIRVSNVATFLVVNFLMFVVTVLAFEFLS